MADLISPWPLTSKGAREHPVQTLQHLQQALSADSPEVHVDGIVGPVTWRALVSGMLSS
jgi:lysozyme family protein